MEEELIEEIETDNIRSLTQQASLTEHLKYVVEVVVDEKFAYFGSWDGTIRAYDLHKVQGSKEAVRYTARGEQVRGLLFLQNFRKIIVGTTKGIQKAHAKDILGFASAEDVGLLFSVSFDKSIKAWNITNNFELVKDIQDAHDSDIWGAAAIKSHLYTSDQNGVIKCWSVPDLQLVNTLPSSHTVVRRLYYHSDRDWLVSCGSGNPDGLAEIWDMRTTKKIKSLKHESGVQCAAIVNDVLLCGTKGGDIVSWRIQEKNNAFVSGPRLKCGGTWLNCIAVYLNRVVVTGGGDNQLQFWHGAGSISYKVPPLVNHKIISKWTTEDVFTWVQSKGFSDYAVNFLHHGVDGKLILELNEFDLREDIGLKHIAKRKLFLQNITDLKKEYERQSYDLLPIDFDPAPLSGTMGKFHSHPMIWQTLQEKRWQCAECGQHLEGNAFRCEKCNEIQCPRCFIGKPLYAYDLFLSHKQANGGDTCQSIKLQLENIDPLMKIFLDVDDLNELHSLEQLVRHSRVFLLLLTDGVLLRPFVQLEIKTAIKLKKKVVLVWDEKSCQFPSGAALENIPDDVKPILNVKAIPYDIREKIMRQAAIHQVYTCVQQAKSME